MYVFKEYGIHWLVGLSTIPSLCALLEVAGILWLVFPRLLGQLAQLDAANGKLWWELDEMRERPFFKASGNGCGSKQQLWAPGAFSSSSKSTSGWGHRQFQQQQLRIVPDARHAWDLIASPLLFSPFSLRSGPAFLQTCSSLGYTFPFLFLQPFQQFCHY